MNGDPTAEYCRVRIYAHQVAMNGDPTVLRGWIGKLAMNRFQFL
ncbi:hypothetical protein FHW71_003169 [Enterobacter sp. Sphag1F]|nr:hypothetical protein [Enterobacter sp. Sphag1F]